jgi:hypothetical protein
MNELALFAGGGGGYLQDICSDGEQFVPFKSKITHAEFYCKGKLMDSYLDSLSGTTSAHSMESLGQEKLMSSQEASLVKTCLRQEKVQDLMENDQDSGEKWQGSFAKYDQNTHSLRTHQCSLFEDSTEYCATLPKWGSMRTGECWELPMLELNIKETEFGLWPTPTTPSGGGNCGGSGAYKNAIKNGTHIPHSINPSLYEWLMGWPTGWTDLKPSEMDKSLYALQQHGES